MNKLTELYIKLTEILKIQLYLKKENEQLTRQINKEKLNILFALDAVHPNDNYEYLNVGIETNINNMLSVRAGYPGIGKKDAIEGITLGFGLEYPVLKTSGNLIFEYTSADFGPLGSVERLSIGFNF